VKVNKRLLWYLAIDLTLVLVFALTCWARPSVYFSAANGILNVKEYFTGVENCSVLVAGHRVHYLAEGPSGGTAVVLVHGLGGHAEDWLGLARYLAKAGYRVYMPDLIGFGRSERPEDFSYSVPDEAGVVVGFLNALGLKQVELGGWSMGGWIVQEVASQQPARISRLMLFDSAGLNEKPAWDTRLFTPTTPTELNQFFALLMPHPPRVPEFAAPVIVHVLHGNYWVIRRAVASMLTGQDATDNLLPQLKMPVLIVWGDADRIFPLSQGERMHRLVPRSQLEVIPGCGHLAPVQCTAQIGPKIVAFVKQ
jgi:pimeloyl-ACP methyl ester carboxylesterase